MKSPSQYHIQKRKDGSNVVDFSAVAEKANIVSCSYLFFYVGIFHFKIGKSITKAIDRIFIRDSVDNLYIGVIALILCDFNLGGFCDILVCPFGGTRAKGYTKCQNNSH